MLPSSLLVFLNTPSLGPFSMFSAIWVVSALCTIALSAPTFSTFAATQPVKMRVLSEYFQMLGRKVQAGKNIAEAPVCNMNNAVMPGACK